MNKTSTKKIFLYISLSIVLVYFCFVLICYNANILEELYDLKTSSIYYVTVYLMLVAVCYWIDSQSRKEPGFLTFFCLPAYSGLFLLAIMMMNGTNWQFIVILLLVILLLYIGGYYCFKKPIEKLLLIKNGYENIMMLYDIIHLFIVLFIAFKMLGLL